MKMFNEWTQQNHGDFLAGFISGMKITDNTQPYVEEITLEPMGVGGKKGLGISLSTVLWNEADLVEIQVYTRNVTKDTAFGMFSVTVEWDSSRGYIAELLNGTFGTFGDDVTSNISAGRLNVYGYKNDTDVKFEDNIILFTIRFMVTGDITKDSPIRLSHNNTSNYRGDIEDVLDNYTSIGQWRDDYGGMWGFLSPIENGDGLIVSEKEKETTIIDDGDNNVSAFESPSLIAIGSGSTEQGQIGAVGIWTNANLKDNIYYNKFTCNLLIDDVDNVLNLINILGTDGWTLDYSVSTIGTEVLVSIIGTRGTKVTGMQTVGSLVYSVNYFGNYDILLHLDNCTLYNDDTPYAVINRDGSIYYPHGYNKGGNGQYGGYGGGGGGVYGYGGMWSGSEQIVWISINNSPKVPIYVKPGYNDVHFYIPYIFPDNEVTEGALKIETEDYIWIPAGFRIIKDPGENTPSGGLFFNVIDRIRGSEVFDLLLQHMPEPTNLDEIIDSINSADVFNMELQAVKKKILEEIDSINSADVFNVYLEHIAPPIDLDGLIDAINSVDIMEIIKRTVNKRYYDNVDGIPSSEVFNFNNRTLEIKQEELTESVNSSDEASFEMMFAQDYIVSGSVDDESHGSIQGLGTYEEETIVTLKALPAYGWQVDKWYINDIEVSDKLIYRVKLFSNIKVYLTFKTI